MGKHPLNSLPLLHNFALSWQIVFPDLMASCGGWFSLLRGSSVFVIITSRRCDGCLQLFYKDKEPQQRPQLISSACFSLIYPSIIKRFYWNIVKIIFQQSPNSPENFVKLYAVFQKVNPFQTHLANSRNALSNGLTFKIYIIIFEIFHRR